LQYRICNHSPERRRRCCMEMAQSWRKISVDYHQP